MSTRLLHVPARHPLSRLAEPLKQRLLAAQQDSLDTEFPNAAALCGRALDDLRLTLRPPPELADRPASVFGDLTAKELLAFFVELLTAGGVPGHLARDQAKGLAHQVQLLRAFARPEAVIADTGRKVATVVASFPATADHIRRGRNPGDVLDPFILSAAQTLLCAGDFEHAMSATVAHKALMIIEGLLGHLHEDVIGAMRGNVRAPEPRAEDQETLDPLTNPFPGADVIQPPLAGRPLRFHQIKSKTGSAKGGDGRRLGLQLAALTELYGGEAYYDALIGNTLRGHRSMAGVVRAAPNVVVLVGESAFRELKGSPTGPELLLRLYLSAFEATAQATGYTLASAVTSIYLTFKERADELGEGFLEAILHDATAGPPAQQDSRAFLPTKPVPKRKS